jgi:hypothetical protein
LAISPHFTNVSLCSTRSMGEACSLLAVEALSVLVGRSSKLTKKTAMAPVIV